MSRLASRPLVSPSLRCLLLALVLPACGASLLGCSSTDTSLGNVGGGVTAGSACSSEGASSPATDGCNQCTCASGTWECTQKDCAGAGTGADAGGSSACVDGATTPAGDGCNTCACSQGAWACTERACAPCTDGATKPAGDGCNTCSCSSGQWLCTKMACPACPAPTQPLPNAGVCPQVVTYAKDPASGVCCQYGTSCEAPSGWQLFSSQAACEGTATACVDGQTQPSGDGCNTCSCSNGQWLCTMMACSACPAPSGSGTVCVAMIAYAKDPVSGVCCEYPTPCDAPSTWQTFGSLAECRASGSSGACAADSDCKLVDDYCGGCNCLALSTTESAPACTGTTVSCLVAPCMNKTVSCVSGVCTVSP